MTEATHPETRYPLEVPLTRQRVTRMILDGYTDQSIADEFGVNRASVTRFRQRYQTQIAELAENQEKALADYAISRKEWRVAKLQEMADGLDKDLKQTGYTYREQTRHGEKVHAHPAAAELRATLNQSAIENDQLPRAGITIANQNVVIVKQVTTEDANPEL